MTLQREIKFRENEENVFDKILEYATSLQPPTVPRLAGGFVRDKLLGIDTEDVDVALDNISGYDFAVGFSAFFDCESHPHKIKANPEKSKHLETAVFTISGISIDFVNLRSESYADTRIPQIHPGTPEEDAFRRDITINSLFYNLRTKEIEDFTGRGVRDMISRVIDTPLDPIETLFDDPLRILRIFRFKAKLMFNIAPRVYEAIKDPRISRALREKVSCERVGIELGKLLGYPHGHLGILEVLQTEYVASVFKLDNIIYLKDTSKSTEEPGSISLNLKRSMEFWSLFQVLWNTLVLADSETEMEGLNDLLPNTYSWIGHVKTATPMNLKYDPVLMKLYMILHNFTGIKATFKRKPELLNVFIIRDLLRFSKPVSAHVHQIERGVEFACKMFASGSVSDEDLISFVLLTSGVWGESILIAAIRYDSPQLLEALCRISSGGYGNCHEIPPIVNGNDLKEHVKPNETQRALHRCRVFQIKNKSREKKKIIDSVIYDLSVQKQLF